MYYVLKTLKQHFKYSFHLYVIMLVTMHCKQCLEYCDNNVSFIH